MMYASSCQNPLRTSDMMTVMTAPDLGIVNHVSFFILLAKLWLLMKWPARTMQAVLMLSKVGHRITAIVQKLSGDAQPGGVLACHSEGQHAKAGQD